MLRREAQDLGQVFQINTTIWFGRLMMTNVEAQLCKQNLIYSIYICSHIKPSSALPLPSAPVYRFGTANAEKGRGEYLPLEVATSEKELCELLFDIPANKNIKLCEECSRYSWIILNLPLYLTFSLSLSHSVQHSKVGKPSSDFDNHSDVCQPAGNILAKKYQTCSCCLLVASSCNCKQMERDTWATNKKYPTPLRTNL